MKKIFLYIVPAVVIGISACNYTDTKKPGYEFMPDMYRSPSYETYSENPIYADSMEARQPVAGTIARGDAIFSDYDRMPYPYPNTTEGYEAAGTSLTNPIEKNELNMAEGKRLYMNYCTHCHGETGQGDGLVTQAPHNGPKPPAYNGDQLKNLPVGKMFHTVTWGKNMMGSHASQLTPTQRWKIIMYVQTLQHPAGAEASADSTQTTAPAEKK
jgi:mono/diheme cytochrome c family protein